MEHQEYSVYISYNPVDTRLVLPVYRELTRRGLSCWFWDREQLRTDSTQVMSAERLRASRAVLVCLGTSGIGAGTHEKEVETALSLEASGGLIVVPVLLAGAVSKALPASLADHIRFDLREGLEHSRMDALAARLRSAEQAKQPPEPDAITNPELLRLAYLRTLDGRLRIDQLLDDGPGALRRALGIDPQSDTAEPRAELAALAERHRDAQPSALWLAWAGRALARDA